MLAGPVVDQAALHGVLRTLRDTGLPLLSLTQVDTDPDPTHHLPETDMTTIPATATATAPNRVATDATRRTALVAGLCYLVTFIASIPAAFYFLPPVLENADYIVSAGADTRVL